MGLKRWYSLWRNTSVHYLGYTFSYISSTVTLLPHKQSKTTPESGTWQLDSGRPGTNTITERETFWIQLQMSQNHGITMPVNKRNGNHLICEFLQSHDNLIYNSGSERQVCSCFESWTLQWIHFIVDSHAPLTGSSRASHLWVVSASERPVWTKYKTTSFFLLFLYSPSLWFLFIDRNCRGREGRGKQASQLFIHNQWKKNTQLKLPLDQFPLGLQLLNVWQSS